MTSTYHHLSFILSCSVPAECVRCVFLAVKCSECASYQPAGMTAIFNPFSETPEHFDACWGFLGSLRSRLRVVLILQLTVRTLRPGGLFAASGWCEDVTCFVRADTLRLLRVLVPPVLLSRTNSSLSVVCLRVLTGMRSGRAYPGQRWPDISKQHHASRRFACFWRVP